MISTATDEDLGREAMKMIELLMVEDPATDEDLGREAMKMIELLMVEDPNEGEGPTTLVEIATELLKYSRSRLSDKINPPKDPDLHHEICADAIEILTAMAVPVALLDRDSSAFRNYCKVFNRHSRAFGTLAVDAIRSLKDSERPEIVDLRDIKLFTKLGERTAKDWIFDGGPTRMENAKIAVIQFQISPSIIVSDYTQILKEEEEEEDDEEEEMNHILGIVQRIKATGCNTLLIPKSILISDLSLHCLAEAKIMVIKDVEINEIEIVTKTLNCLPIANIDYFSADKLGQADLVEEFSLRNGKILKITVIKDMETTTSLLIRTPYRLVLCTPTKSL